MTEIVANKGYVYFGLFGCFDPDTVTARLGVQPTFSCAQGQRNPRRGLPKMSQWEYASESMNAENLDMYPLAETVVTKLEPYAMEIKAVVAELNLRAVLQTVLYFSTDDRVSTPAIGYSPRVIKFLVDVGASIDIDTYLLPNTALPAV